MAVAALLVGCVADPQAPSEDDLGQSSFALEEVEPEEPCEADSDCADGAICEEGSCASCACPLANPVRVDYCAVGHTRDLCLSDVCFATDGISADCSASYTGAYCGCRLVTPTQDLVMPPSMVAESSCNTTGQYLATKLFKRATNDPPRAGYDTADCNWTP